MTHVCDDGGSVPSWAVPVLAPTSMPGVWSDWAVPSATTSFMFSRIVAAVCGDVAVFHTAWSYDFTTVP